MGAFLVAIADFLVSLLSRYFTLEVAKFLAYKVLLKLIVFTGLLIVAQMIVAQAMDWALSSFQEFASTSTNIAVNLTGIAAWLFQVLRLHEVFSIILSAISTKLVLRLLPLSPVR